MLINEYCKLIKHFIIFLHIAITTKFNNATYTVNEDAGIIQPQLILSNPSSFVETVQMITTDVTAYGNYF